MTFMEAVKQCFSKYATFSGRAPRSELWWFTLFLMLVGLVMTGIDMMLFGVSYTFGIADVVSLATFLPSIAVGVRRMHDLDRSGWWLLLYLVPVIGWIVLIYWQCSKGTEGPNRFGADPLGGIHSPEIFR